MIIKLASATSKATGFVGKTIERLGLGGLSKRVAENPHLKDTLQNASLIPTIALGDGAVKVFNRKPGESKLHAFGHGAAEGAFAGGVIAAGDQAIGSLARHGAQKLSMLKGK